MHNKFIIFYQNKIFIKCFRISKSVAMFHIDTK